MLRVWLIIYDLGEFSILNQVSAKLGLSYFVFLWKSLFAQPLLTVICRTFFSFHPNWSWIKI